MVSDSDAAKKYLPGPKDATEVDDGAFTRMAIFLAWVFLILSGVAAILMVALIADGNVTAAGGAFFAAAMIVTQWPAILGMFLGAVIMGTLGEISRKLTVMAAAARTPDRTD